MLIAWQGTGPSLARRSTSVGGPFALRHGVWTDVGFETGLRTIEIVPYSQAYFELVRRLPALKIYFALSDRLLIVGEGVALKLAPGGVTELSSAELRTIVEGLDGSL